METMWAPWRMKYVGEPKKSPDKCIFCDKPLQKTDRENCILFRGASCFIILNAYPYNNAHAMIIPYRHCSDIAVLTTNESAEMWQLATRYKNALEAAFHPEGYNIGMNLGRVAGAGIDQHLHLHILPRWNGDTNFMSSVANTRVISQEIFETYDLLKPYFETNQ